MRRNILPGIVAMVLVAVSSAPTLARPPGNGLSKQVQLLERAAAFSAMVGEGANPSQEAQAFRRVLKARRDDIFLLLTKHKNAAARLYGACGLHQLGSEAASTVLANLARERAVVVVIDSCIPISAPISQIMSQASGSTFSQFEATCGHLRPSH